MYRNHYFHITFVFLFIVISVSACSINYSPSPLSSELTSSPLQASIASDIPSTEAVVQPDPVPPQRTSTPNPYPTPTINDKTKTAPSNIESTTPTSSFSINCKYYSKYTTSLSPNGKWLAITCDDDLTLEIVNKTGQRWILKYEDYAAEEFKEGDGRLQPIIWQDNGYLFFASQPFISAWGSCLYYGSRFLGLYKIDLQEGTVTATIRPLSYPCYQIAFSPSGQRLAYIGPFDHIAILDMKTGETNTITVNQIIGNLTWSPDGLSLAYGTCTSNEDDSEEIRSTVNVYSFKTHVLKRILENEGMFLGIDEENTNPFLKIAYDHDDPIYTRFYDWSTGQFVEPRFIATPF